MIDTLHSKLDPAAFVRAMRDAGAVDPKQCYLVDDSAQNVDAAKVISTIKIKDDS